MADTAMTRTTDHRDGRQHAMRVMVQTQIMDMGERWNVADLQRDTAQTAGNLTG